MSLKKAILNYTGWSIILLSLFIGWAITAQETNGNSHALRILTSDKDYYEFQVELALTSEQIMRGLMFRESMPENHGMLFYFGGYEAERGFWMKNTLIPLDIIFIRADGTILRVHENAIPHDLTSIRSFGPAAAVLEINGGLSKRLGLQAGDRVIHDVFD